MEQECIGTIGSRDLTLLDIFTIIKDISMNLNNFIENQMD